MKDQSLFEREHAYPVETFDLETISTDPVDWIVRIHDVVNDSRLYRYPACRKWAIQCKNPSTGKRKTFSIHTNSSYTTLDKAYATGILASYIIDGIQDFAEYYSGYTGDYTSEWDEYPRKEAKPYHTYCQNLYRACTNFFPAGVMQELEEYA